MGFKALLSKPFAAVIAAKIRRWNKRAVELQEQVMHELVRRGGKTLFGKDHQFSEIKSYEDFKRRVPIRDYEALRPYIDKMVSGEADVLWPGKPLYLAKTSGTTSGVKYIPLTKDSLPHHIEAARDALLNYIHTTGKADFVDGKMIFLQGSPTLQEKNGIKFGRLSGIVAHYVPGYLQNNRLPSFQVNCMDDWEDKVDAIVEETITEDMRLISGIPPWVQMYFDRLSKKTGGKRIKDIFRNFSLFVYGGVNYEPYRAKIEQIIGKSIPSIETYPASEGFIAFQDRQGEKGMLLLPDSGIFYEFIPVDTFFSDTPTRLSLSEVELDQQYALIINSDAGLWGYNLGDTVKFVSLNPFRIVVTGRIKHFISAFGEHVIGEEVEQALLLAIAAQGGKVTEFTVAPQVDPGSGKLPYHEWFIEFEEVPEDIPAFAEYLDDALQKLNSYYYDLVSGKILQPLIIRSLPRDTFVGYMRSQGKLGGQNKLPRLSNDRTLVSLLEPYLK